MENWYTVKSRNFERQFARKLRKGSTIKTGIGRNNTVVSVDEKTVTLQTERGSKPIRVPRSKVREAFAYMYRFRTCTRKDLERFVKFNSALMGILKLAFCDIAKCRRTVRGLLRLSMKGVRHVFCTGERAPADVELIKRWGGRVILLSYWTLRNDKYARFLRMIRDTGVDVILDSGAFSYHKAVLEGKNVKPLDVHEYADFIEAYQEAANIIGYMNLDVIGQAEESARNAEILRERGLQPIVVWHIQSDISELEKLVRQDHQIIAIGGSVFCSKQQRIQAFKQIFERFPDENFHLLGNVSEITMFPWFSTDSSSWLQGRKSRKIVTPSGQFRAPGDWSTSQILVYNIESLATLEDSHDSKYLVKIPIPPVVESVSKVSDKTDILFRQVQLGL